MSDFSKCSITRTILLLIVCLFASGHRPPNQHNRYVEEEFSFPVLDGELILGGTLTIPDKFAEGGKVAILVSPPLAISRDYSGLFKGLAEKLSQQGITVLRYDNRAYADSSWANDEKATMFSQADDASSALSALKKDKRFAKSEIGFIGHSEGGAAVAIAASRNTTVPFIVVLASMGINGLELAHSQATTKIKRTFFAMPEADYIKFSEGIYQQLKIIAENEELDSIKQRLGDYIRERYRLFPEDFGKMSMDESVQGFHNLLLQPRLISYVQFQPELYYSQIACPAYIVCGSGDTQVDCEVNLKGIERIFQAANKKNYKSEIIDGMDHSLKKSAPSKKDDVPDFKYDPTFNDMCTKVANWVKEV